MPAREDLYPVVPSGLRPIDHFENESLPLDKRGVLLLRAMGGCPVLERSALDLMIGAHALATGMILVTTDRAFGRIKKLKVGNWAI